MVPIRDESGALLGWYGANTDIDDLKHAQMKLRQDERELRRHEHCAAARCSCCYSRSRDPGSSGSWDRSAVDHVLSARDRTRSWRGHERDEICNFSRPGRSPKRNAAEREHDDLLAALVV